MIRPQEQQRTHPDDMLAHAIRAAVQAQGYPESEIDAAAVVLRLRDPSDETTFRSAMTCPIGNLGGLDVLSLLATGVEDAEHYVTMEL